MFAGLISRNTLAPRYLRAFFRHSLNFGGGKLLGKLKRVDLALKECEAVAAISIFLRQRVQTFFICSRKLAIQLAICLD